MKIIEPSAELVNPASQEEGITVLRFIEKMARISHRSEIGQTEDSWHRFLASVIVGHGDWSCAEHSKATVIFRVDRALAIELRTHRFLFCDVDNAYTQESTRFVRYGGKQVPELEFIMPIEIILADKSSQWAWTQAMVSAEREYFQLLEDKISPQAARSVLPHATAATIAMTANFRAWRWFFQARCSQETHPDLRAVTIPLLDTFKQRIPLLFDDVEPNLKQSISMGKVH